VVKLHTAKFDTVVIIEFCYTKWFEIGSISIPCQYNRVAISGLKRSLSTKDSNGLASVKF
jgi:hypothetical protein